MSNIGTDRNWTGSHFNQANWYAFGRLAWDQSLTPEHIADEWSRMTFTNEAAFVEPVTANPLSPDPVFNHGIQARRADVLNIVTDS